MSNTSFDSELARVLARPDIEEIRRVLGCYHERFTAEANIWPDECDTVLTAHYDDPELALAFALVAGATYDDRKFLAMVAAGGMEDLLRNSENGMAPRMVAEAQKFARFRWMLSGVWLHAIHPDNVDLIRNAVGNLSMDDGAPLPPRPFA